MELILLFLFGSVLSSVSAGVLLANNEYDDTIASKSNQYTVYTFEYRLYFWKGGIIPISPFHDINYHASKDLDKKTFNMIVEIPIGTDKKMKIGTCQTLNPIFQDLMRDSNGDPIRPLTQRTTKAPYPFNYGAMPQTWENSIREDPHTGMVGDNDPIDIVEIGSKTLPTGSIVTVKILGVIGLVDGNETDWKLIAINIEDEDAGVEGMANVATHKFLGQKLIDVLKWFDSYTGVKYISSEDAGIKTPAEIQNPTEKYFDSEYALKVVEETHKNWIDLSTGRYTDADFENPGRKDKIVALEHVIKKHKLVTEAEAFAITQAVPQ